MMVLRRRLVGSIALVHCSLTRVKSDVEHPQPSPPPRGKPAIVSTWRFGAIAVGNAREILEAGGSSIDAVVSGVRAVELDDADQYFVGVGGLPNADGVMELDAAIMDDRRRYGAVMAIRDVKSPISVARAVMERSEHNIFAGEGALQFALEQGFRKEPDVLTQKAPPLFHPSHLM